MPGGGFEEGGAAHDARPLPAGPRLRRIFLLVGLAILGDTALYIVLPVYAASRGLSLVWVGIILSANRFVRLATNPVAARALERWGTRRLVPAAMLAAAASTAVYGLTVVPWLLLISRLIWGFIWSLLRLSGFDAVTRHAGEAEKGAWLGRFRSFYRAGSLTSALTAGFLADTWGFAVPFLVFALVAMVGAAASLAWRPWLESADALAAPGTSTATAASAGPPTGRPGPPPSSEAAPAGATQGRRDIWFYGATAGWISEGLVPSTLGLLVLVKFGDEVDLLGLTVGAATFTGLLLALRWSGDLLLAPLAGTWFDRRGPRRSGLLIFGAAGLLMAGLLPPVPVEAFTLLAALLLLLLPALITLAETLAVGEARSRGHVRQLAAYTTAADMGSALGPLGGYALGAGIGIGAVYGLAAGLAGLTAGLIRQRGRREDALHPPGPGSNPARPAS